MLQFVLRPVNLRILQKARIARPIRRGLVTIVVIFFLYLFVGWCTFFVWIHTDQSIQWRQYQEIIGELLKLIKRAFRLVQDWTALSFWFRYFLFVLLFYALFKYVVNHYAYHRTWSRKKQRDKRRLAASIERNRKFFEEERETTSPPPMEGEMSLLFDRINRSSILRRITRELLDLPDDEQRMMLRLFWLREEKRTKGEEESATQGQQQSQQLVPLSQSQALQRIASEFENLTDDEWEGLLRLIVEKGSRSQPGENPQH